MCILIKSMEMPTSPVLFCIHPDGKVFADLEGGWREYKAVTVPDHGDLIDRDALLDTATIHWSQTTNESCFPIDEIEYAPTIIPKDEVV